MDLQRKLTLLALGGLALAVVMGTSSRSDAQPSLSASFSPATIGPGSASSLTFTATNPDAMPASNLSFVATLPAGLTLASPVRLDQDCLGTLSASPGESTLMLSGVRLGVSRSCSIRVDVTSSLPGTAMLVTGDITASTGNGGPATADLTVDTALPGFTMSFSPDTIPLGASSRLTLLLDNTSNGADQTNVLFQNTLPEGMTLAPFPNAVSDCASGRFFPFTLSAEPGSRSIALSQAVILAGTSCTVSADVVVDRAGAFDNVASPLTTAAGSSGFASATLNAEIGFVTAVFEGDPVPPGGVVDLVVTIQNFNRSEAATNITFTDDLDATLSGLTAIGLPLSDPCGPGSTLSGTSALTLS